MTAVIATGASKYRCVSCGDRTRGKYVVPTPPAISQRVGQITGQWNTTTEPTQTHRDAYRHAGEAFTEVLASLRVLIEQDLKQLEDKLEAAGVELAAFGAVARSDASGLRTVRLLGV